MKQNNSGSSPKINSETVSEAHDKNSIKCSTRKRIDLNGDYLLLCAENKDVINWPSLPVTVKALEKSKGTLLTGKVPGNFELDLHREGLIEDPFLGTNVWKMQKLESMHIFYGRYFSFDHDSFSIPLPFVPILVMEGVDTVAEIFLNGRKIGDCSNMFLIHEIPIPEIREGENELVIHILPACIEARKNPVSAYNNALKYNYETLRLRKSASMFGWDITPRIVSAGLWRPVFLECRPKEHIRQAYLMTLSIDDFHPDSVFASLQLFFDTNIISDDLSEYEILVKGRHEDSFFEQRDRLWFTSGKLDFELESPHLWWPRGYGQPCLYETEVCLYKAGTLVDRLSFDFGVRTVFLNREDKNFQFLVNGEKIFLMGTNFVPIDVFHSRDRERLPEVMDLFWESGCNSLRIWGGNVYEDDFLYEYCDRKGILIWQDFMMACAIHPTDRQFCHIMQQEAVQIIRRLRQHPSLMVWSGDNECDQSVTFQKYYHKNPNRNRVTREILRDAVDFEDPVRPYLPSSPYYGEEWEKSFFLPEDHLWGPRDYYKSSFYKESSCLFAGEIGYHGCASIKSMKKFIPEDSLWPWQDNDCWLAHASSPEKGEKGIFTYRINLMASQIQKLFGHIPDDLEDFVLASQISQAEAMKFFIELFRLDPRRTGILWWNLIDGWPQFSDAAVDYYFEKKLAFYYIQQVQQPLLAAMREPDNQQIEAVILNGSRTSRDINIMIRDINMNDMEQSSILWKGCVTAHAGITSLSRFDYRSTEKKIYLIEWESGGHTGKNHYLCGEPPFSLDAYKAFMRSLDYPLFLKN